MSGKGWRCPSPAQCRENTESLGWANVRSGVKSRPGNLIHAWDAKGRKGIKGKDTREDEVFGMGS